VTLLAATTCLLGCNVTFLRLARLPGRVAEHRGIRYRPSSSNPKHQLDIFAPENARGAPVVHFVHGGYWVGGDKDYHTWLTGLYGSVGRSLAARGLVTVIQSYRLVPEVTFEQLQDDVMAGLRWTEEHVGDYGGDPTKIVMMGHSAGGHLVALAGADDSVHTRRGMNPDAVRGYIPISAVWDVGDMHATQNAAFHERVTYRVFGRDPATWARSSPLERLVAKPRHPFLIMIGDRDYPYLIPQAERARAKLITLGAEPRFHTARGNDHDAMVLAFASRDDNLSQPIVDFVRLVTAP
jgi:acetyl esterase/lipase